MIWCLTRKVVYLICYKILHTLWFGVLQESLCIWFVIRYYIRYDLVSYKKGFVSDLLWDITYVMIWCLTRKVVYLICYKILYALWFGVLQESLCIWFVIRYYIRYDLVSYKKGFVSDLLWDITYVMIWCLTRKVVYLICYKILHMLWFGVLQERFCIWFVIRYYIRYDLVSYKKGFVSDLLWDITYVMIWCLTRKVVYLICYKILHMLWFGVLQERFCIWFVIRYCMHYDLVSYKKGFVSDLL